MASKKNPNRQTRRLSAWKARQRFRNTALEGENLPNVILDNENDLYHGPIRLPEQEAVMGRPLRPQDVIFGTQPGTSTEDAIHASARQQIRQGGILPETPRARIAQSASLPRSIPDVTGGASPAANLAAALMQGNPDAHNFVEDQLRSRRKDTLADQFLAETYTLHKRLGLNAHQQKFVDPIIRSYRWDMMKAHKFELDNDFVRYVTEISSTCPAEKLLTRIQYATLPYDITWIEFDLKTKVRVMRALHDMDDSKFDYNDVADRLGLLMHRLSDTEFTIELICETHGNYGLIGTTVCYFVSVRDYDFTMKDKRFGCTPMVPPPGTLTAEQERINAVGNGSLWGYTKEGYRSTVITKAEQMRNLALPAYLARHGCIGTGRMRTIIEAARSDLAGQQAIAELMVSEAIEFTGMVRWVVIVLACLNEVPIDTHHVQPTGQQRVGLTNHRKLFDYHRVTLRVPKEKPVQWIERQLRSSHKKRAHEVRSHWRTYTYNDNCKGEHVWQYDYDEGFAVCGKCVAYRRLIHEHVRGDPTLGWVQKSYVVKPAKQP